MLVRKEPSSAFAPVSRVGGAVFSRPGEKREGGNIKPVRSEEERSRLILSHLRPVYPALVDYGVLNTKA